MKNIDHIGIAVKDLEASNKLFASLLNTTCYKIEDVPNQQVSTSFFKTDDQKIELIAATSPSSPITKFIDKILHIIEQLPTPRRDLRRNSSK